MRDADTCNVVRIMFKSERGRRLQKAVGLACMSDVGENEGKFTVYQAYLPIFIILFANRKPQKLTFPHSSLTLDR